MFVEIGHFYANDPNYNLDYLKDQEFRDDDKLCIFIDDYSNEKNSLDVIRLLLDIRHLTGRHIFIARESSMVDFFYESLQYLDKSKLEKYAINGNPTELYYDGRKLYDYVLKRPTCQMLSYIWTLYRLGVFTYTSGHIDDTLLIIDQKYANLEDRVFKMIPKQFRKHLFYRYFKP